MIEILGFSDPVSSWSHLGAAVAAFIGAFFLARRGRGNAGRVTSLLIYSFSLIFLFSMSGVYHLLMRETLGRIVLQRLDYAGIWVLIAGTFTPIHVILFRGAWRWGILLLVWAIAITGLVLQVIFFESFPYWLTVGLFLGLGWMGILTGYKFRKTFRDHSLKPLIYGGLAYSAGAVSDAINWPTVWPAIVEAHEIFHFFVILGAWFHWRFIYEWADHPIANEIYFNVTIYHHQHYVARASGEHLQVEANSLEALKTEIREKVYLKYRNTIVPTIHLRYFNEERLN